MMCDARRNPLGYNGDEFNRIVAEILALMALSRDPFNVPRFRILIACLASRPGVSQVGCGGSGFLDSGIS
jgi:hypothetical protein